MYASTQPLRSEGHKLQTTGSDKYDSLGKPRKRSFALCLRRGPAIGNWCNLHTLQCGRPLLLEASANQTDMVHAETPNHPFTLTNIPDAFTFVKATARNAKHQDVRHNMRVMPKEASSIIQSTKSIQTLSKAYHNFLTGSQAA